MSQTHQKRRGPIGLLRTSRRARWLLAIVIAGPILYLLSLGPVTWLTSRGFEPVWAIEMQLVDSFYSPIRAACEHFPPLRQALNWYTEPWNGSLEDYPDAEANLIEALERAQAAQSKSRP